MSTWVNVLCYRMSLCRLIWVKIRTAFVVAQPGIPVDCSRGGENNVLSIKNVLVDLICGPENMNGPLAVG